MRCRIYPERTEWDFAAKKSTEGNGGGLPPLPSGTGRAGRLAQFWRSLNGRRQIMAVQVGAAWLLATAFAGMDGTVRAAAGAGIQADERPATRVATGARKFTAEKRYLNFPVKTGAEKRRMSLSLQGIVAREFEIELADGNPDFWVFLDLEPFRGKELVMKAENSVGLDAIVQSDGIVGGENLYRERLRPQFHFSSRRGWNNDPNGLVFYQGEYHLYYQHNPYGWDWGNMHWGHAVSRDLVHWTELPIAIYPRSFGDWAFSGSAVVDWKNSGGFKTGKDDVLVAAFTSTGRGECIVFSNDRGRTWTEYEHNPVVRHEGRDPRLLWHAATGRWVMAVYDEYNKGRYIAFYSSADLKRWVFESRIEGFYECPDLFELALDGERSKRKWVLSAASSEYMVGSFDGRKFTPETPKLPGHRGNAFYAAQTFSDIPSEDGRRLQIGWGQMPSPGMPFNQMMCFPCELSLRSTAEGPRLAWQPVRELEKLRGERREWRDITVRPGTNLLAGLRLELLELRVEIEPADAKRITLNLGGVTVGYDAEREELSTAGVTRVLHPEGGLVSLHLLLDRTSLEVFADKGLLYMPLKATLAAEDHRVELSVSEGAARVRLLDVTELKSAWEGSSR